VPYFLAVLEAFKTCYVDALKKCSGLDVIAENAAADLHLRSNGS
jgi:hypothetical protein